MASTPSARSAAQACSTLLRESGACTSPELITRSPTSRVSRRGTSGWWRWKNKLYDSGRLPRPMMYTSRVPRVTMSPVLAPLRSISVLMAMVEPWISSSIRSTATPLLPMQLMIPWTRLAGVVRLLAWRNRPASLWKPIRSVNVPPMSTATKITPGARLPKLVIPRSTLLTRTSEAKGHQRHYDSSAASRFEVPKRGCGRRCRNFKSAAPALLHPPYQSARGKSTERIRKHAGLQHRSPVAALTAPVTLVYRSAPEALDAEHQGTSRAHLHCSLGRAHRRQGRGGAGLRVARYSVGCRTCTARLRRDGPHLFCRAGLRQACRRGAPLWAWQGREPRRAGGDRAPVPPLRRGDLGGGAAAHRARADRRRGHAVGVCRDRHLDRRRFF